MALPTRDELLAQLEPHPAAPGSTSVSDECPICYESVEHEGSRTYSRLRKYNNQSPRCGPARVKSNVVYLEKNAATLKRNAAWLKRNAATLLTAEHWEKKHDLFNRVLQYVPL
ncbi:uncharacterized protein MYCFIDRAFT_196305 [Pseudocercospora fijiensis CIRAD86]|uniref:Uncharacterized protein n=1 Tax=Pseudocercospora fijiensis (strain CIRAD86) TaxID=383855 RepID=M3AE70_PSEFD|nr:uncharacterized protein MYCFIDRAFT_196305 [Pseudocercospora fijiensis CIRAD86]EME82861.1 hypothetical protein MYCFIDRAFT_196305 [Pseudocercospora fijiensis CIRAD86]